MYYFYLGEILLPVAPEKMTAKIAGKNQAVTLINEGEINLLKTPGLTEYKFSALLPNVSYPFAEYPEGYRPGGYYLDALEQLAVVFDRAFFGMGPRTAQKAFPYESVYTSEEHLLMQDARDSAVAFYLGEELGLPADNTTPEDHLSFEFQFMAKLIERAGAALDAGDEARYAELCAKQRAFFDEHLANWVPRLCADVRAYAQTAFYRGVADITEGFLQLEDQMIGQSAQAA